MTTSGDKVCFSFTSWISLVVETNIQKSAHAKFKERCFKSISKFKSHVVSLRLKNDSGLWGFLVDY